MVFQTVVWDRHRRRRPHCLVKSEVPCLICFYTNNSDIAGYKHESIIHCIKKRTKVCICVCVRISCHGSEIARADSFSLGYTYKEGNCIFIVACNVLTISCQIFPASLVDGFAIDTSCYAANVFGPPTLVAARRSANACKYCSSVGAPTAHDSAAVSVVDELLP